jgi:quercetin dioxygenase-like cupin family protein
MTQAEGHTYTKEHPLKGEALLFDLHEQGAAVLGEAHLSNVGRSARTLIKDGSLRLTILGIAAGSSLKDHAANGPVSIHVLHGEVDIHLGDRSERLPGEHTLVLGANVVHSLSAATDAVVLLTISL